MTTVVSARGANAARDRIVLALLLAALAATYAHWYRGEPQWAAAWAVFALPPALLAAGVALRRRTAPFWSGVLALGWFCHGVMLAWDSADDRAHALVVTALAVAIIVAGSLPGLRARRAKRRAAAGSGGP